MSMKGGAVVAKKAQQTRRPFRLDPTEVSPLAGWYSISVVAARTGLSRQGVHHLLFHTGHFVSSDLCYIERLSAGTSQREYLVRQEALDAYVATNRLPGEAGYQRMVKAATKAAAKTARAKKAAKTAQNRARGE